MDSTMEQIFNNDNFLEGDALQDSFHSVRSPALVLVPPTGELPAIPHSMYEDPTYQSILEDLQVQSHVGTLGLAGPQDELFPPPDAADSHRSTSRSPNLAATFNQFALHDTVIDFARRESAPALTISPPTETYDAAAAAAVPLRPSLAQSWSRIGSAPNRSSAPNPTTHSLFSNTASAGEDQSGSSREASPGPETRRTQRAGSARGRPRSSPARSPTLRRAPNSSPQLRVQPYPTAVASGSGSDGAASAPDEGEDLDRREARKKYQREWSREKRAAQKKAEEDLLATRAQLSDAQQVNMALLATLRSVLSVLSQLRPDAMQHPNIQTALQQLEQLSILK